MTGVLATALHNIGCWLLKPKTQRKLNGINSRMLARVTGRSIRDEAREPTLCAVQWDRASTQGKMVRAHLEGRRIVAGKTRGGGIIPAR